MSDIFPFLLRKVANGYSATPYWENKDAPIMDDEVYVFSDLEELSEFLIQAEELENHVESEDGKLSENITDITTELPDHIHDPEIE